MATIRTLTFESGLTTGADAFDTAEAGIVVSNVEPVIGGYHAVFQGDAGGNIHDAFVDFGVDHDDVYVAFYFRVIAWPTVSGQLLNLITTSGSYFARLHILSAGAIRLWAGAYLGTIAYLELGTIYRVEIVRKAPVAGSDGVVEFWLADGNGASTMMASKTNENTTSPTRQIRVLVDYNTATHFEIDELTFDDAAVPSLAPIVYPPTELEALTILEYTTRAYSDITDLEAVTILETVSSPAEMQQDHALRAVTFIETQTEAAIAGEHNLRAVTILETLAQDQYSGPGTGLLTGDPATADMTEQVNRLRDGDTVPILSSWAGVDGISGLMRVLRRSIDDSSARQTIDEPYFIPLPDPSLPSRQQGGSQIRTAPDQRSNVFRQVKDQQRKIDRKTP